MKLLKSTATLTMLVSLTLGAFAFAESHDDVRISTIRRDIAEAERNAQIKMDGSLLCSSNNQTNAGKNCVLALSESASGKVYFLNNTEMAMQLFTSGTRNVAIEGTLANANTINIVKISAN